MKKIYFLFIPLLAVIYSSCHKINDDGTQPDTLKGIALNDTLSMYAGNVIQINYTLTPSSYDPSLLIWKSSDTSIIAVTNTGKVSAKKEGTSTISVTNQAKTISVSCIVAVKDSLSIGLIAHYPFNNNAVDATRHGYDGIGTDLASTTDRFGNPNSAYYFNGTSSYVVVTDKPALRLNNTDFTLNMWINLDEYNISSGSALLAKNSGPYQNGWNCSVTGLGSTNTGVGDAFYNVSGGDDPHAFGNTVIGLGKWTMVTITYNLVQQQISFYINGMFDHSTGYIPTPNPNTTANLFIGKNSYIDPSGLTPRYYIKGKLDDIRIYKRKVTTGEITKLYNLPY
jgi:Concanavalin A-like lectin/glucanases superfamily/Bacterial Ig-like domain (group 2)